MALGVTLSTPDSDRVSLHAGGTAGQDQGRPRRPRGRGSRVRHDHHRRRVRHPAADPDRAPDGRALGHERGDRARRGAAPGRPGTAAAGRQRNLRAHPAAGRRRGRSGSSRAPTTRSPSCWASTASSSRAWPRRCSTPETLDAPDAYRAASVPLPRRGARGGARLSVSRRAPARGRRRARCRRSRSLIRQLHADGADREADSAEATIAVATTGESTCSGEAQRGDRRGHAELGGGGQRARHRQLHERHRSEQVDGDVEPRQRRRQASIEGSLNSPQRSSCAPSTTKYSGTKKPSAMPRTWVESRFGPPIEGHHHTRPEARDQDARAALLREPGERRTAPAATAAGRAPSGAASRDVARDRPTRRAASRCADREQQPGGQRHERRAEHARARRARAASTIGTDRIVSTSAIVTCAITASPRLPRGRSPGSRAAAPRPSPEASTTA